MTDRQVHSDSADRHAPPVPGGNLTDATVVCRSREWKVHKLILATRNEWFRAAFFGHFVEATTNTITLDDEEDPDLIDILLRFIYETDVDLLKLEHGEGLPALCVKVFRVADFFLADGLKTKASQQLRTLLEDTSKLLARKPADRCALKFVTDALEALEEAYDGKHTTEVMDILLHFVYLNMHQILRSQDCDELLASDPIVAVSLLRRFLRADIDMKDPRPGARFGLPVHAAVNSSSNCYQAEEMESTLAGSAASPFLLYPDEKKPSAVFTVVDPQTHQAAESLMWMVPSARQVNEIRSHPNCRIVRVCMTIQSRVHGWIYLHFDRSEDARLFVERYCQHSGRIRLSYQNPDTLSMNMQEMISSCPGI